METEIICKPIGCKLCAEYSRKRGCRSKHCAYFAERIAAGTLNHKEAILEAFRVIPAFSTGLTAKSNADYLKVSGTVRSTGTG